MEASSHALDQGRLDGLSIDAAVLQQSLQGPSRLPLLNGGILRGKTTFVSRLRAGGQDF